MPFMAVLAFALLQALAVFSPATLRREELAGTRLFAAQAVGGERRVAARSADLPEEALPVARTLGAPLLPRLGNRPSVGDGNPPAALVAPLSVAARDPKTRGERLRVESTAHVVAARGSLLPYFPTAPPLQG
jgi:hypothetical protein